MAPFALIPFAEMEDTHSCKALVIHCIDYRFVEMQAEFLSTQGYKDQYDLLTVPGSSKNLHSVEEWVALAIKLHDPREILIFDHEECGGYGADNSIETHRMHLNQAKNDLAQKYPDVKIETFIATFDGVKEIS